MSLDRFKTAQSSRHAGYDVALTELEAGRKTSHWIWYIFPQLVGLGRSSMAETYALENLDEAVAYLRDPVLGPRLLRAVDVVAAQLAAGAQLTDLMGSEIDALKLVSSLTLFEIAARATSDPALLSFAARCGEVLTAAEQQGYPRCAFTLAHTRPRK